jgi:Protein of unknown function (DUF2750)
VSVSATHADAFYRDVVSARLVWTLRDDNGYPAPLGDGARAMPFWSSLARVERVIANVAAYRSFSPVEIELRAFRDRWLPGLERDGLKAGLNWSGERAVGYDIEPQEVASRLAGAFSADL